MFKKIFISLTILLFLFLLITPAQAQQGLIDRLRQQLGGREVGVFVEVPAEQVVVNVIMWIMSILGIIAVGFIIYGGIMYATSGGNEKQIEQAKKILLYAIIGLVIAILALVIATLVTVVVTGGNACEVFSPDGWVTCYSTPCRDLPQCTQSQYYPGYSCTPASSSCPAGQTWGRIDNMCGCR